MMARLATLSVSQLASYFYPRMFGLHDMDETCGVADAEGRVVLPTMMSLTIESLTQDCLTVAFSRVSSWHGGILS